MPSDDSKKIPPIKMSLKDALKAVKDKKIVVMPGPLPHTLPSYKEPNYNHFCTLSYWHLDEAVLLLNGINPEAYENNRLGMWKKFDYFNKEVQRTYKVLERAHLDKDEDLGAKTDSTGRATVKPIKLFEFAKKKRLPIPDQLTEQFDGLKNPIVAPVQNIKNKPSTKSKKSLTKTQQRVLDLAPQWQEYARKRLAEDSKIKIAKVIRSILRNDMALDPSGEDYADKTIRKYIKEIWPKRGPGRPQNN